MNVKTLLTLIAGLAIGGIGGYALVPTTGHGSGPARIVDEPGSLPDSEPAGEDEGGVVRDGALGEDRRPIEQTEAPATLVHFGAGDEGVPESARSSAAQGAGDGVIAGLVVDVRGDPVEGVLVALSDQSEFLGKSFERGATMQPVPIYGLQSESEARDGASRRWASAQDRTRFATSDARGRFVFEGLAANSAHTAHARVDGAFVLCDDHRLAPGDETRLVVHRIVPVRVAVATEDARPVESCELSIDAREGYGRVRWTVAEPIIELIEGENVVRAYTGAFGDVGIFAEDLATESLASSDAVAVQVTTDMGPLELVLRDSNVVRVAFDGARPLPTGLRAFLELTRRVEGPSRSRTESEPVSGEDTVVHFGGVEPGIYDLRLRMASTVEYVVEHEFEYLGGVQDVLLVVPELRATEAIRVRALGPDGEPIEAPSFSRGVRDGNRMDAGVSSAEPLGDGWWSVADHMSHVLASSSEGLGPGQVAILSVGCRKFGAMEVELTPGVDEYEVRFAARSQLNVTIVRAGEPVARRERLVLRSTLDDSAKSASPDRDGEYVFRHLEPGTYELDLLRDRRRVGGSVVNLVPGENRLELLPDPTYELEVHCIGLTEGQSLNLEPIVDGETTSTWSSSARVDTAGRAAFEGLPAGRYRLSTGFDSIEVDVPCGSVTFETRMPNGFQIVVFDDSGTLARLGFRDGDRLVGHDGRQFDSLDELYGPWRKLCTEEVPLLVQRDGSILELVTPILSDASMKRSELGGAFHAVIVDEPEDQR